MVTAPVPQAIISRFRYSRNQSPNPIHLLPGKPLVNPMRIGSCGLANHDQTPRGHVSPMAGRRAHSRSDQW
jgi:hypothetical protein